METPLKRGDLDLVIDRTGGEAQRAMDVLPAVGFVPAIPPLPTTDAAVLQMFGRERRQTDVFARFHISFDELPANSRQVRPGRYLHTHRLGRRHHPREPACRSSL